MLNDSPLFATLPAADLQRARQWYQEKLDLKPVREDFAGLRYETGSSRFLVYESEFSGTNQATAAGFEVDDIDAAVEWLRGRGVEFQEVDLGDGMKTENGILRAPDGNAIAWFSDSEGNILAVGTG